MTRLFYRQGKINEKKERNREEVLELETKKKRKAHSSFYVLSVTLVSFVCNNLPCHFDCHFAYFCLFLTLLPALDMANISRPGHN